MASQVAECLALGGHSRNNFREATGLVSAALSSGPTGSSHAVVLKTGSDTSWLSCGALALSRCLLVLSVDWLGPERLSALLRSQSW